MVGSQEVTLGWFQSQIPALLLAIWVAWASVINFPEPVSPLLGNANDSSKLNSVTSEDTGTHERLDRVLGQGTHSVNGFSFFCISEAFLPLVFSGGRVKIWRWGPLPVLDSVVITCSPPGLVAIDG